MPERRCWFLLPAEPSLPQMGGIAVSVEVKSVLSQVGQQVLVGVSNSTPNVESSEVLVESAGGVSASVPTDPARGILLDGAGSELVTIELPFGDAASDAVAVDEGIVAYDNHNGSLTVPIVKDDASVQVTTIIDGPQAPTRYDYAFDLPPGGSLHGEDGGAVLMLDSVGSLIGAVLPPWATDAKGAPVPTT